MRPLGCQSRSELAVCDWRGNTYLQEIDALGVGSKFDMLEQLCNEERKATERIVFKFLKRDVNWERFVVGLRFVEECPVDGDMAWLNCWSSSSFHLRACRRHEPVPPWNCTGTVNRGYVSLLLSAARTSHCAHKYISLQGCDKIKVSKVPFACAACISSPITVDLSPFALEQRSAGIGAIRGLSCYFVVALQLE